MTTQFTRRTMLKRSLGVAFGGAAVAATGLTLKDVAAQPVTGTGLPVEAPLSDGGLFTGVLTGLTATLDRAAGVIDIAGTLVGTATDALGVVTEITQEFTSSITQENLAAGDTCDILFLDLGPIFLDVLGLTVDLSEVVLDVNAVSGAGNLLGNLLCAVTGLLDNGNGGPLAGLTNLLNRIFSILG